MEAQHLFFRAVCTHITENASILWKLESGGWPKCGGGSSPPRLTELAPCEILLASMLCSDSGRIHCHRILVAQTDGTAAVLSDGLGDCALQCMCASEVQAALDDAVAGELTPLVRQVWGLPVGVVGLMGVVWCRDMMFLEGEEVAVRIIDEMNHL